MSRATYGENFVPGTPGVTINDIAHVIIPGRGRDMTGMALSQQSFDRAAYAGQFYTDAELATAGGWAIASGYKTPGDTEGLRWSPDSDRAYRHCQPRRVGGRSKAWYGIPEAYLMVPVLWGKQVPLDHIGVEPDSIDTVTNFANIERDHLFGEDDRPVAIVAQAAHLKRALSIAEKVLRRPYGGLVVPENDTAADGDSALAGLMSQTVLLGLDKHRQTAERLAQVANRRAHYLGNQAARILPHLGFETPYHTDPVPNRPPASDSHWEDPWSNR